MESTVDGTDGNAEGLRNVTDFGRVIHTKGPRFL
jgi:hypothetical protein